MNKRLLAFAAALTLMLCAGCAESSKPGSESSSSVAQTESSETPQDSSSQVQTTASTTTSAPDSTTTKTTSLTEAQTAPSETSGQPESSTSAYDPDAQRKLYSSAGEGTDTDKDGLPDSREKLIGTDPKKPDTDGDGLTDYQEYCITGTDPNKFDSIKKETSDAKVDLDSDGLSNEQEIKLGTDPKNPDTDGDGMSDGDEVRAGTDPLRKNDTTTQKQRGLSEQPVPAASDVFKAVNKTGEPFTLSMKLFASENAQSKLSARETNIADLKKSKVLIGKAVDLVADASLDCRSATLYFRLDKDYVKKNLTFGKKDRDGIKAVYIAYFDKQANALLPLETTYDEASSTVSAQFTGELTTFMLVDSNVWDEDMMKSWASSRKDMGDLMKLTI